MPEALPWRARWFLAATVVAAAGALLAALLSLPRLPAGHDLALLLATLALGASAIFFLQSRSMTLPWSGERLAIHPDETVVMVLLWFAPPGGAVVAAAAATLMSQAYLQKPPVKAAFNVAAVTLAAAITASAYAGLLALGAPALLALAAVPFLFAAAGQTLVAALLTLLARRPLASALRPQLARSVAVAGSAGVMLGGLGIILLGYHPLALVAAGALALVMLKAMAAEYRHESELAARRALNRAMTRLDGNHDEESIIAAVFDACREAFILRGFEVTLQHPDRPPRRWSIAVGPVTNEPITLVRAPLVTATGARLGELVLTVGARGRQRLREDEELAAVFAGYLAVAAGQAEALRLLAESRQQLKDAFDAAQDPIVILERDGRVVHANRAALASFGPHLDHVLPRVAPGATTTATIESGAATRHFELSAASLRLDSGQDGVILIGRDVTERLRMEAEAAEQRELISRNERLTALGTLVAGVAHEVNNPLMFMEGHLEMAIMDLKAAEEDAATPLDLEELRKGLETVLLGARRIEFISKGLRVIGRTEPARQEPVRMNALVEEVATLVRAGMPANARVVVDPDPRDPVVQGDPHELHQVVLNLARNGIEALPWQGGRVVLQVRASGDEVVLAVSDDGPGISEEARSRIFSPFYTTKIDGTGLGLPMVHSLVHAHRGTVTIDDPEPGRGATFRVRLPRAKAPRLS